MRLLFKFAGIALVVVGGFVLPSSGHAQEAAPPALRVGPAGDGLRIDGLLDEPAWAAAEAADAFAQTDPSEGAPPTFRTTVRALANENALMLGIICDDAKPEQIVSFSVRRDAGLTNEDHVQIVLGPFHDGQSGYVFTVNPSGARYDGLINPGQADGENSEWDGIWEAATARSESGWSVEIRIPIQTLSFKPGLREWHFNVQRRVQRLLETDRWAFASRQHHVNQTSRAGLLTGLPDFALGRGFTVRPAMTARGGVPAPSASVDGGFQPSLDITQRLGSNILGSLTVNTDFAETEVDTRRTNLTRFPLLFPEKRTFFLEGADIFQFGPVSHPDFKPYFSRRIGLVNGVEVPIIAGAKVNGRVGNTNVAGLVVGTDDKSGIVADRSAMAVARVRQNLWQESYVGGLMTIGDPLGRPGSWLAGADLVFGTSRFLGNKNFLAAGMMMATGRGDLRGDTTAQVVKLDYPNDKWDVNLWYKRIGRDFDPSMGFVPRPGVQLWYQTTSNRVRVARGPIQEMTHSVSNFAATDLAGRWESYSVSIHPLNWRFRSGDRVQISVIPTGERLLAPFEISRGVVIPPGTYEWLRSQAIVTTAQKRRFWASATWRAGPFYDGDLDEVQLSWVWNPTALYTIEFSGERNTARLASGRFTQNLIGTRLRVNFSPDLSIASYAQYDTDSDSVGVNTRLRWTFLPVADLFIVYNHNVRDLLDRWGLESNQLLMKLQYAWRM